MIQLDRLCAHRGANLAAPENTLPAFSLALGRAKEIELDVWPSADGELFVCHDRTVDRTTNGHGRIADLTREELKKLDAGSWFSKEYAGVTLPTLEEALALIGGGAALNIHIKSSVPAEALGGRVERRRKEYGAGYAARPIFHAPYFVEPGETLTELETRKVIPYDEAVFERILQTVDRHHARGNVYITGKADVLLTAKKLAPELPRCALEGDENYTLSENALKYGCARVQFCKLYLTREDMALAKRSGLHVNLFWSDSPEEAEAYIRLGVDTILTNDILTLSV